MHVCSVALGMSLWDPMDCIAPGSSVHGILQARTLEWVAMPSSRGSFQPRDWTCISCIAGRFFTAEPPGKPFNKHILIQTWERHDSYFFRSLESSEKKCSWHCRLQYQAEGKNNFGKVLSNTEGTGAECPRWWFSRCLFSPEAAHNTARKSAASLLTPLPTAAKLVKPFLSFLLTQGNISNLIRDNLIFPPRDFLWVLTTTGPVRVGPRTTWALRGQWHLLGGGKKRVLLMEAEFCLRWKLKMAKEKKKKTTLILWASKSRVFSTSSPEIMFSFLNLSPSSWRSTSSKSPPLTSRPSSIHLSIPVAPRLHLLSPLQMPGSIPRGQGFPFAKLGR